MIQILYISIVRTLYEFEAHSTILVLRVKGVEGVEGRVKIGVGSQDTTYGVVL
jgi:hypothetical protein